jgi:two-component system, NtrC family, nitrogen regulation sensor histidine kinase GlnL
MPARPVKPGRFETQVRLVLVLVVAFLLALDLLNLVLLSRTRDAAERAERDRARSVGREVAMALGPAVLVAAGTPAGDPGIETTRLERIALRFDVARLAVLAPDGATLAQSADPWPGEAGFAALDAGDRATLAAGRAIAAEMTPSRGGGDARIASFVPVLDSTGRLAAIVLAQHAVPELGSLHAWFRRVVAVQSGGVVVIGALVLFFGRWVSRPYRRIAEAAGEAGLAPRGAGSATEPDDIAAAFRAVANKLREQESASDALGKEGGGLADLVRFAGGAASGMATGVMVCDRRGRIAAANPAADSLLGVPPGSSRGTDLASLGRRLDGLRDLVRSCLDEGRSASREVLEVRAESGRTTHLGVTISPVGGPGGDTHGALVLMSDLTEIRQVAEQVRLRENLAAVGGLSAGIAHEFRNALGTILGYAKMLEKSSDPRVHGPAGEISKEVGAVRAEIDEFLLYARPPEPQRAVVDLGALIAACATALPRETTVEIAGSFGHVIGDEALLRRVFENLVRNAGEIGLEAGRPVSVRIVGRVAGRSVQVEVEDDGPGIPPDKRASVFLPFFTTRARGTGLGLALVQRTLVDLGGSVEVGEGPRGGAAFRLRLPLAPPEVVAAGQL